MLVAILRFLCNAWLRNGSRLPACIAPRRWYGWAMQRFVPLLLAGVSLHQGYRQSGSARLALRHGGTDCRLAARNGDFPVYPQHRFKPNQGNPHDTFRPLNTKLQPQRQSASASGQSSGK